MRKLLPASALFVLCAALPAAAQLLPLTFQTPGVPTPPTAKAGKAADKSAAPGQPGDPKNQGGPDGGGAKESPRMAKLKQLQFDRRPSAVLKAWAPTAKKDADKD